MWGVLHPHIGGKCQCFSSVVLERTRRGCWSSRSQSGHPFGTFSVVTLYLLCLVSPLPSPLIARTGMRPVPAVGLCQKHMWLYLLFALCRFIYTDHAAFYFCCIYISSPYCIMPSRLAGGSTCLYFYHRNLVKCMTHD